MEFVATCAAGFEPLLAQELKSLNISEVRPLKGQVSFQGELENAYRALMYSRIASRVLLILARVDAQDSDALYEGVSTVAWEDHLARASTFAVSSHGTNAELKHSGFVALRAKDAIADRMLARAGVRPQTDVANPNIVFDVRLRADKATVAIDLTGEPLFQRGWTRAAANDRHVSGLRADYAAALLAYAGWYRAIRREQAQLVDVFCGSGSLMVEAATQAFGIAPGTYRSSWGHLAWLGAEPSVWQRVQDEALATRKDNSELDLTLVGIDSRPQVLTHVRSALRAAGVPQVALQLASNVHDGNAELSALGSNTLALINSCALSHQGLPGEAQTLQLCRQISAALPSEASMFALTQGSSLSRALGREEQDSLPTMLGQNEATMVQLGPAADKPVELQVRVLDAEGNGGAVVEKPVSVLLPQSDQFAARLTRMYKHLRKWARKEGVDAWRVYDADLADYNVAIDLLDLSSQRRDGKLGEPARWAYIAEYEPPKQVDRDLAHLRLLDILNICSAVLNLDPSHVVLRTRERSRGGSQYGRQAEDSKRSYRPLVVQEGGLLFEINLRDYLDYGLFLDHRDTRALVREYAKQIPERGRFLNLFAYTGSATCYAADGGATRTTTVDMSNTYLAWAERNLALNGFTEAGHDFVRADVLRWISDARDRREHFDLVFCDPPTFSNSSRMRQRGFDVQRDHVDLLFGISRLLTPGGRCIFSCNLRSFTPDLAALERGGLILKDISDKTIPVDYANNPKVHHCYELTRAPREARPDREPHGERSERKPYRERSNRGDRKPYGERSNHGDRKPYGKPFEKRDGGPRHNNNRPASRGTSKRKERPSH